MTARRRAEGVGAALCGILLLVVAVLFSATHAAPARADTQDDGNISVVVTDGSTPSPTASVAPVSGTGATSPGSSGAGGSMWGGTQDDATGGTGGTSPSDAAGDEVSVGGGLYVGGLDTTAALSPDPAEGIVTAWFTVRNASASPIDATADFWMTGVFGNQLDAVDAVAVTALQPGETRVVTAQLHHGGQWILLSVHATLTPPETIDGTPVTPVTRDALVWLFPWLIAIIAAAVVAAISLRRLTRRAAPVPDALMDAA